MANNVNNLQPQPQQILRLAVPPQQGNFQAPALVVIPQHNLTPARNHLIFQHDLIQGSKLALNE
ncbi:1728_t:CDS:2 [Acaulospora morrowiae]|uniref:1728_t:CDS:1 n=1 Tax=Acaulospora morrowiae TaxID=94023 RepID=A0A9N8W466_9GLOM|nr:1728_t:CDS:2 [Acaulospora morrowiae]